MRKCHIYLTSEERKLIIESLISEKNTLISAGKYTDCVDDLIIKFSSAKMKNIRIKQNRKREQTLTESSRFFFGVRCCLILASRPFG